MKMNNVDVLPPSPRISPGDGAALPVFPATRKKPAREESAAKAFLSSIYQHYLQIVRRCRRRRAHQRQIGAQLFHGRSRLAHSGDRATAAKRGEPPVLTASVRGSSGMAFPIYR